MVEIVWFLIFWASCGLLHWNGQSDFIKLIMGVSFILSTRKTKFHRFHHVISLQVDMKDRKIKPKAIRFHRSKNMPYVLLFSSYSSRLQALVCVFMLVVDQYLARAIMVAMMYMFECKFLLVKLLTGMVRYGFVYMRCTQLSLKVGWHNILAELYIARLMFVCVQL